MPETLQRQPIYSTEFKGLVELMTKQIRPSSGTAESLQETSYPLESDLDRRAFVGIEEKAESCIMQLDGETQKVDIIGHVNVELTGGSTQQHRILRDGRAVRIIAFSEERPVAYSLSSSSMRDLAERITPESNAHAAMA